VTEPTTGRATCWRELAIRLPSRADRRGIPPSTRARASSAAALANPQWDRARDAGAASTKAPAAGRRYDLKLPRSPTRSAILNDVCGRSLMANRLLWFRVPRWRLWHDATMPALSRPQTGLRRSALSARPAGAHPRDAGVGLKLPLNARLTSAARLHGAKLRTEIAGDVSAGWAAITSGTANARAEDPQEAGAARDERSSPLRLCTIRQFPLMLIEPDALMRLEGASRR